MSSLHTNNAEQFLKDFQKGKFNLSFFLGGVSAGVAYGSSEGDRLESWQNISVLTDVRKRDAQAVVNRINWTQEVYYPWSAQGNASGEKYYAYNPTNRIVYLCTAANSLNRKDLLGTSNSTILPTTETTESLEDGYTWKALYKVGANDPFLTETRLPVPDVEDYDDFSTTIGLESLVTTICGSSGGQSGACGLYPKQADYDADAGAFVSAGNLRYSMVTSCWDCFTLGQELEMESRFLAGVSLAGLPSGVSLETNLQKIQASKINPSSSQKFQANLANASLSNDGEILSMLLDLSSVSKTNRIVSIPNPEITITSATGSGAKASLVTYVDAQGNNVVDGLKLTSGGKGYFDFTLTIPSISNASTFVNQITVNIEPLDGYATSARKILNCNQIAFNFEFTSNDIDDVGLEQSKFTTFGILKDAQSTDDSTIGKDKNLNEREFRRNTINLVVPNST
jgi:hypothetical protein